MDCVTSTTGQRPDLAAGNVTLGFNTDTEQHDWTTSATSRSWGGLKKKTTTTLERQALGTELKSDKAVRVGVGSVTDLRGAILDAPKVSFLRSAGADTTQPGQLILGASVNTSQTSHTEKTTTAGVWQKQAGHGSTTQTANQTQIHGELTIDERIQTTVLVPDVVSTSGKQPNASAAVGTVDAGTPAATRDTPQPASKPVAQSSVQSQIDTLSQQPGLSYLSQLQNNPNANWSQIQLAKDQWSDSQQGLTPAGEALLAIAIAVYTGGMGAELLGTTTSAAGAAGAAGASTAAGAALNAGFGALVSTAGISFVNNGSDIGQTLKDMGSKDNVKNLLIAIGTGGVGASVAGQGFTAVAAQNLTGCVAGEVSGAQVTVNGVTTDTSKNALTDSHGKFVETDTKNRHRSLVNTDIANLQQQVQQEQADNMLAFKAVTTFTDEANRTLYKVGAQVYRVPPGCSDKSCAVLLDEEETRNLKPSQDGKVHLSNNGILNDLDGAVKYAQQHGGKSNPDGSKDYSEKPDNQYIVFAPEANNPLSELMIAGVQKSGLTPYVGHTNPEAKTSELVQQTTRQDKSIVIVIDSHSRGTLTTDNALQFINNQGGITDGNGNTIKPNIQLNNYGGAQNNESGNKTLQQVTGNENAQINSVVHPKDLVGASVVVGHNPVTPNYSSKGTQVTNVESKDDGKGFFSNLWNILFGKATPHNCYGTSGNVEHCDKQWKYPPKSNSPAITKPDYKAPVIAPQYQPLDTVRPQVQQSSNEQMNQLLESQPLTAAPMTPTQQANDQLETLKNFKQEQ